jgi:ribosomal protein S18 acetylase RimI-like enzyme
MMQLTIRRATLSDAEKLTDLSKQTFYDTFTGTCTEEDMQQFLEQYFNLELVKSELANEDDFYFFGEFNGKPVAYIRMMEDYSGFSLMKQWKALELKRIYVDQSFHGKGLAKELMNFVENFAKEKDYEVLWLGVWEHNERAKKFYQKSGFSDSGHTHFFPIGATPQTDQWFWKFLK